MRKASAIAITLLLFFAMFTFVPKKVSAYSDNTWVATTTQSASNSVYWQNGSLVSGQNIWFVDAYDGSCNWNVAGTFGDFHITTGYAGTITQQADFTIASYKQVSGLFSGSATNYLTCLGNWDSAGGSATSSVNLIFSGNTNHTLKTLNGYAYRFQSINVGSETVTFLSNVYTAGNTYQIIGNGGTIIVSSMSLLIYPTSVTGGPFSGSGTITTTGIGMIAIASPSNPTRVNFDKWILTNTQLKAMGALNTDIYLTSSGEFRNLEIVGETGNAFTVYTQGNNLNIHGNFSMSTVGNGLALSASSSTITCSGNWDSSVGTFIPSTSKLHLTGSGKTIKTGSERIANLFVDSGASYTMYSNVYTNNYWENGIMTRNGYTLFINNDQPSVFTSQTHYQRYVGDTNIYHATAYDRENEARTFTLVSTNATGVAMNATTGMLTKSVAYQQCWHWFIISVSDGNHTTQLNITITFIWSTTFTTSPTTQLVGGHYYWYAPRTNTTSTWTFSTNATWLSWNSTSHTVYGQSPNFNYRYWVNITISTVNGTNWNNYTLQLVDSSSVDNMRTLLIVGIVFMVGIMLIAVISRRLK
jgi:hypothetical protein